MINSPKRILTAAFLTAATLAVPGCSSKQDLLVEEAIKDALEDLVKTRHCEGTGYSRRYSLQVSEGTPEDEAISVEAKATLNARKKGYATVIITGLGAEPNVLLRQLPADLLAKVAFTDPKACGTSPK